MKKIFIILALVLVATSSPAFWPFAKTKTATLADQRHSYDQNAQTVSSVVQGEKTPPSTITVSGTNNAVNVDIAGNPGYKASITANADARGNSDAALATTSSLKVQLPWCIAGLLGAAAIVAIIKAVQYARSVSPAVNAAIGVADNGFSKLITTLEAHARTETDPGKLNLINSVLADANKHRGIVKQEQQ